MKLSKRMMGTAAILMAFSIILASCASTKASAGNNAQTDSDYDEVTAPVVTEKTVEADDEASESNLNDDSEDLASVNAEDSYDNAEKIEVQPEKENNIWSKLLISQNNQNFVELDSFTYSTTSITGKLKQQDALFFINKKNYDVGFGSPILAAYYIIFMEPKTKTLFINAVDSYFNDFENKKLNRKDKKSIKRYGKAKVDMYWGLIKNQTTNYGSTDAYFGYTFKDKSPYFTITIYPTLNEKRKTDDSVPEESMMLNYYFTKAQCRTLANYFKDVDLSQFIDLGTDVPKVEVADPDSY